MRPTWVLGYLVVFSESFLRFVSSPRLGFVGPPQNSNGHFGALDGREEDMNCVANYEPNMPESPCDGPCCEENPPVMNFPKHLCMMRSLPCMSSPPRAYPASLRYIFAIVMHVIYYTFVVAG